MPARPLGRRRPVEARRLDLKEYQSSCHRLTESELNALGGALPSLDIRPEAGAASGTYRITPGSTVGAVEVGDLSVLIRPKLEIPQLLSILCYAMGRYSPQRRYFEFPEENALPDALALSLASAARRAFSRGLLHGYRVREEALHTVRGRIRFRDQLRRRFGSAIPIEVRYDEFTDDILANQLVKAAAARLVRMRLRSQPARRELGRILGTLENVSGLDFEPRSLPTVRIDRLNEHYGDVIALSQLVLSRSEYEARRGQQRSPGFLVDMNMVFQDFVTQALREKLGVSDTVFLERSIGSLDEARQVNLKPDLTWWFGRECLFVGDAKYKVTDGRGHQADIYQMLAYMTALDLPGGLLIYAKGEADPTVHTIRHSGRKLVVASLDLSGSLDHVLGRVGDIADEVKALRDKARDRRLAA